MGEAAGVQGWMMRALRRLIAVLLGITGVSLLYLGGKLLWLGGSPYYVLAGGALCLAGRRLWSDHERGSRTFVWFYIATVIWAIWEAGLDFWALSARLAAFTAIVMVLVLIRPRRQGDSKVPDLAVALAAILVIGLAPWQARTPNPSDAPIAAAGPDSEWLNLGNSQSGERFAELSQITPANVGKLEKAWSFKLPDDPRTLSGGFQSVPIKAGNMVYVCTGFSDIHALDAQTGKEVWAYRHKMRQQGSMKGECRGVSFHRSSTPLPECTERVLHNTLDARLMAFDAKTGARCTGFGKGGEVDLLAGLGEVIPGYTHATSPPMVVRGKAVINGRVSDGQYVGEPGGVIRAFDAITGQFAWAWDMGRPGEHGMPGPGEHFTYGTPNSWGPMSADEALGSVFVPTGNATPDYWSGHRRDFDNKYSSSVVALNADTGEVRWSFQTVHLDIWDYDVASQPLLVDFPMPDGKPVPAVIQGTKQGEIYVLDRRTGEPLTPVEEQQAPRNFVKGQPVSPTQPWSVGFPSVAGPDLTERMMWGLTPIDQAACRVKFRQARYEGKYTPIGLDRPTMVYPSYYGGMNWAAGTVDRARGLLIVGSARLINYDQLMTQDERKRLGVYVQTPDKPENRGKDAAQVGTPYGAKIAVMFSPIFSPCNQPPYGVLTAIDLKTRKVAWERPIGTAADLGPLGMASRLPLEMGVPLVGSGITTRTGLTFLAGVVDPWLRAIETASGRELWRAKLPESPQSIPVTYVAGGRQYVVVSAGGVLGNSRKQGEWVFAYALPQPK